MSGISTGTGLISGIDTASLIKQLMSIESQPLVNLQSRITSKQKEQQAYSNLVSQLTSFSTILARLALNTSFQARAATSSQPTVLTATADNNAALGNYSFTVKSVVSTHQIASSGFATANSTPVGQGTLLLGSSMARVSNDTELSALNGGAGIRRGSIRITDRSGASVKIDLQTANTMNDVLNAINQQSNASVRAHLNGDKLVIEDETGLSASAGTLTISEVNGGKTATDLGILGTETDGRITSSKELVRLTGTTTLASLNDGLGVRTAAPQFDFNTSLAEVNGGTPMGAGKIGIMNKKDTYVEIELKGDETFNDINKKIADANKDFGVKITSVSASGVVVTDSTGGSGKLTIVDVKDVDGNGGNIAEKLQINKTADKDTISGGTIGDNQTDLQFTLADGRTFNINLAATLGFSTRLNEFNGGLGVGSGTIKITNKKGDSANLTITGTETLQELNDNLKGLNLGVQISTVIGSSGTIMFSDSTADPQNPDAKLKIEDVGDSKVASQLRISTDSSGNVTAKANYSFTTVNSLTLKIQNALDTSGKANDGAFEIAIGDDGKSLKIIDHTGGTGTTVKDMSGSGVLADLGFSGTVAGDGKFTVTNLDGQRVLSGINTVLLSNLNGGQGVEKLGTVQFTLSNNSTVKVDFTGATTLQDIIGKINEQPSLSAEVGPGGVGLVIYDNTGGSGTFKAEDVDDGTGNIGTTAKDLKFNISSETNQLDGGNLNRKYITETTQLSSLNGGKGIGLATTSSSFVITNSKGDSTTVSLDSSLKTMGDVIKAINRMASSIGVTASINDDGDGIKLVEKEPAATGALKVVDSDNSKIASALHLAGTSSSTGNTQTISGSFSGKIDIQAADTLNDVASKINNANLNIQATIINDGSGTNPYRLILTSRTSGTAGQMAYSGIEGLSFTTLSEARDARVIVGDPTSSNSIVITSSTNKVTGVVPGVTLNLISASDTPVGLNVTQNMDNVVSDLKSFIDGYNAIFDQIDDLTKYDSSTNTKGTLFGDSTVTSIRDILYREVSRMLSKDYSLKSLNDVGITFSKDGHGRLQLDEDKFRAAAGSNLQAVQDLFAKTTTTTDPKTGKNVLQYIGIVAKLKDVVKNLALGSTSVLGVQGQRITDQIDLYNKRATDMQTLLTMKQDRYTKQFAAMESALATLQSQGSALSGLSNLFASSSTSNG
ncbi:MAG: flagellar filament capping protein FliD [Phycisphaerae bacterium]|nr:flagellar filament capping protein FliD [Phycisphaerae bacterium]